jgi:hypothetical protein
MANNDRFEYVLRFGNHQISSEVAETLFTATDARPGSLEKIEILRRRCALRQPLFHPNDRTDFSGCGLQVATARRDNDEEAD